MNPSALIADLRPHCSHLFCYDGSESHEDHGHLRPCSRTVRGQGRAAGAIYQALGAGPAHSLPRKAANLVRIGIAAQVGLCGYVMTLRLGKTVEHDRKLFTGDSIIRSKPFVAVPAGDTIQTRPVDRCTQYQGTLPAGRGWSQSSPD